MSNLPKASQLDVGEDLERKLLLRVE